MHFSNLPFVRLFLTILFTVLLSACATVQSPSEILTKTEPNKGVVLIKMEGNRLALTSSLSWNDIVIRSTTTQETFKLLNQSPIGSRRYVFMGQVPADSYKVETLTGQFTGLLMDWMISNSDSTTAKEDLGVFTVQADRITDLGILVAYKPLDGADRAMRVTRVPSGPELAATLRRYAPDEKSELMSKSFLTWDVADTNTALLKEAQSNVLPTGKPFQAEDGTYWVGAELGQLLKRTEAGNWSSIDTGFKMPVFSVLSLESGKLLAGLDDGAILVSTDEKTWRDASLPYGGTVVELGRLKTGEIVAVARGKDFLKIFVSPDRAKLEWTLLREIPFEKAYLSFAQVTPDEILLMAIKMNAFGSDLPLYRYDVTRKSWADSEGKSIQLRTAQDKNILCGGDYYSTNLGASWVKVEKPGGELVCRDAKIMYDHKLTSMGWSSSDFALFKSTDGGKTWAKMGDKLPASAGSLAPDLRQFIGYVDPLKQPGHLLLKTHDGRIYSSTDDGTTWKLEREVNDASAPYIRR